MILTAFIAFYAGLIVGIFITSIFAVAKRADIEMGIEKEV
jgi:hypothetical protein